MVKINPTHKRCSLNPAEIIIDLVTNPEKKGKAEMAKPPIRVKAKAIGIFLYRPPRSVNLHLPVICRTAPQPINNRPLYKI